MSASTATDQGLISSSLNNSALQVEQSESPAPSNSRFLEQQKRDEEESLALARELMAEEAMYAYQGSLNTLQDPSSNVSQEDLDAIQAVLRQDEERQEAEELEDQDGNLSYDTMLRIEEQIGDVKSERWTMESHKHVSKLESFVFGETCNSPLSSTLETKNLKPSSATNVIDNCDSKCLVCQCEYEKGEVLRRLPCGHCFHVSSLGFCIMAVPTVSHSLVPARMR